MKNLLHNTKHYEKYPKMDFIIDKIHKNDFFTFSKISVEWWQMFCGALDNLNINLKNIQLIESKKIATQMVKVWGKQRRSRPWGVSIEAFKGVIDFITKECPENFIVGITDRTPGKQFFERPIYPDSHRGRQKHIIEVIKQIIPEQNNLYDAMCWKYWGSSGELERMIRYTNNHNIKIVLVGPEELKDFGKVCGVKNYSYLNIHSTEAALHIRKYKRMIKEFDKNTSGKKIYMMQGGSSVMWLCVKLHNKLKNSFMFDVGKGLNMYMRKLQK